ncbi:hypothetical protein LPLM1_00077 [Listeria phage LPML1]|nr:hypothetical protein LPLM1_00077 [Listeria phage LPML1]
MQMFFKTRQNARDHKAGKIVDNGTSSDKRWGREFTLKSRNLAIVKVEYLKGYEKKHNTKVSYKRAFNV